MALLVLKFGGTSVGDIIRIKNVANIVKKELDAGHQVAVVVSAMSGTTNQLVAWTQEITGLPDAREYDAVVAAGEQITAGLTALALQAIGIPSRSWLGWQVPIKTDGMHGRARIQEIDTEILKKTMLDGQVPVVAGFQGVSPEGRITTVGRGGSDTAAVALAAALKADRCDIYTDVDGVYTCDPRIVTKARKLSKISFEEMLEMASLGAKVLQTRSVELAMKEQVRLQVKSTFAEDIAGTFVVTEEEMNEADMLEQQVISGITYSRDEAKITLKAVEDKPGVSAKIFGPLAEQGINVDMIVQNISEEKNARTDMTFTVTRGDVERAVKTLENNRSAIGFAAVHVDKDVAKISVVGLGMRSHVGVAQTMFRTLADKNINIRVIATSEIKISVLIEEAYTELALRALHTAYGLDAEQSHY
jgi:aspartate kinase